MPLASYPLGVGPLGHDPVAPASAVASRQTLAVLIDPGTKDAVVLDDGTLLGVHPVDQAVALAIGIWRTKFGAVPSQGSALRDIAYASADLEKRVEQTVTVALSLLIGRGDIRVASITTTRLTGGFLTEISYRNLRLGPQGQVRTLRFTSTG